MDNNIDRRTFFKRAGAGLAFFLSGQLLGGSRQRVPLTILEILGNLAEKELAPSSERYTVERLIIDYTTNPELTKTLINNFAQSMTREVSAVIQQLKNIIPVQGHDNQLVEAIRQLQLITEEVDISPNQVSTLIGLGTPLIQAVIDQVLTIAGQHGEFVKGVYHNHLSTITASKYNINPLEILPLQGFISSISIELDETGLFSASLEFDAQRMIQLFERFFQSSPQHREITTIVTAAFNFGKVESQIALFETRKLTKKSISEEGYIAYPNNFPEIYTSVKQEASSRSLSIQEVMSVVYPETEEVEITFVLTDQTKIVQRHPAIKIPEESNSGVPLTENERVAYVNQILRQIIGEYITSHPPEERHAVFQDLKDTHLISPVSNYDDKITYQEPYGTDQVKSNFQGYVEVCEHFPQLFMIHAGGNHSDLRSIEQKPANGIVVSSINAAGRYVFGRDGNVGCPGAEMFLQDSDFIANSPSTTTFSTSETVGIISAYAEIFALKGLKPGEIKQVFLQLCCDITNVRHNRELLLRGIKVFNPTKAQNVLRMSRRELLLQIHSTEQNQVSAD